MSYRPTIKYLSLLLLVAQIANTQADDKPKYEFQIHFDRPSFVLPQFTGPYSEREASIAPKEYETAERLKTMLDNHEEEKVLKELEAFYDIELSPAMLTLKAQIYSSLEMYDKAEQTFLAVLKRMPQLIRVHVDLGNLYLSKQDYVKARQHFANAVSFGSNDANVHGQLGYLNLTLNGPFSAISEYQHAFALEPENPQWHQGLLAALSQAKMYPSAKALLRELINKNPNNTQLWLNQAALELEQENFQQALVSIEMAIALGDTDKRNIAMAAQLHLHLNSYDRAVVLLKQRLNNETFNMKDISDYIIWLSNANMWSEAKDLLSAADKKMSQLSANDQSQLYLHKALLEDHLNNNLQADNLFKLSLEKNPVNTATLLSFADFKSAQKDYVTAELLYVRAEAIPDAEKQALLGRSQLYIDMKDFSAALNVLKNIDKKYPDANGIRENIEILERIIRNKRSIES